MRIGLGLSYFGGAYNGWQSQPNGLTIQDKLEKALSNVAGQPVRVSCSGRTDAGVHACLQVAHFDTLVERRMESWVRGTNAGLPRDIAVHWAVSVPDEFHCRSSALRRRYVYILKESSVRPGLETGRIGWSHRPLDYSRLREAADLFIGEHDFSAFRAAQCQALSPIKTMFRLDVTQYPRTHCSYWRFDFEATAFLHHMIRNIMGSLLMVGDGRRNCHWLSEVIEKKNRHLAAPTFPSDGLYFMGPVYDARWAIPQEGNGLDWLGI